jgi:hypothetical protein
VLRGKRRPRGRPSRLRAWSRAACECRSPGVSPGRTCRRRSLSAHRTRARCSDEGDARPPCDRAAAADRWISAVALRVTATHTRACSAPRRRAEICAPPSSVGATGIEPVWSQPAHRTPNAQACAHALDQLHRLFDLEESW